MKVSDQLYAQDNSPGTHWLGGWVHSRAGVDTMVKIKNLMQIHIVAYKVRG